MDWFGCSRCKGVFFALLLVAASTCPVSGLTPPNDNFANRIQLGGLNNVVFGSNVGATLEPGEPEHSAGLGGASVWWSWNCPTSGTFVVTTWGSSFDTLLAVYFGSVLTNLAPVAENDDTPTNSASGLFFRGIA